MINTQNVVFLNPSDVDKKIYRVFSYHRFKEALEKRTLTVVKPRMWDDPFENFILNSRGRTKSGEMFDIAFRDHFYGQCWSLAKESDAMWRIYSPNKDGIKVQSTIAKVFSALFSVAGHLRDISCFIGKVKYQNTKDLLAMLTDRERMSGKLFDNTGWGQASSFYFKRWAFKHEREVRLIFNGQGRIPADVFSFAIDPAALFEKVVFDPRMTREEYDRRSREVMDLGYDGTVIQSSLYQVPQLTIDV